MDSKSRRRVVVAAATVSLVAVYALGSGLRDAGTSDGQADSSVSATPTTSSDLQPDESSASPSSTGEVPEATSRKNGESRDAGDGSNDTSSTGETSSKGKDDESGDPAPDVEVPTPGTGQTVAVKPVQTLAPVPLDSVGDFRTGLTVRFRGIDAVEAAATAPGEISGPGLRVTVVATNGGDEPISLDNVIVFLAHGPDGTPASLFGSLSEPLVGNLSPGDSVEGSYVYAVPIDQRDDVRVEVSYTGSAPTVAFTGSVDG